MSCCCVGSEYVVGVDVELLFDGDNVDNNDDCVVLIFVDIFRANSGLLKAAGASDATQKDIISRATNIAQSASVLASVLGASASKVLVMVDLLDCWVVCWWLDR